LEEKERNSKEKGKKHCQISSGSLPDSKEALISKTLLEEKERKKRCKGSGGPLPNGIEALIFLFKPNISCKAGKIWAVLREGLRCLAGLINITLSHNKGYSA
jgi:hypothetical protein